MKLDYRWAGDLLDRFSSAYCAFDGDAWVDLYAEDAEVHEDPFEPPLVGHNAIRKALLEAAALQDQPAFVIEQHWVVPPTVLAAWHASYVHRTMRARVRLAGFLTLEIGSDERIRKARYWSQRRESHI